MAANLDLDNPKKLKASAFGALIPSLSRSGMGAFFIGCARWHGFAQ